MKQQISEIYNYLKYNVLFSFDFLYLYGYVPDLGTQESAN